MTQNNDAAQEVGRRINVDLANGVTPAPGYFKDEPCKGGAGIMKDTVAGLEMFPTQAGAEMYARFTVAECASGYEVVMNFRGERRFALCAHKNDAEHIAECLNKHGEGL